MKKPNDWVQVYDCKNIPNEAIEYYSKFIDNSLVVYIEASQTIKRIHNSLNIPYIDITVHPIRYLDDNYFGLSSNTPSVENILHEWRMDPRIFEFQAQLIKTQAVQSQLNFLPNSVLIVGQTELDKSLIENKKIWELSDFEDEIAKIIQNFRTVYFKPHPYRKDNNKLISFLGSLAEVKLAEQNIYKILSHPNIKGVVGISSSSIYEASFFNKKTFFLRKSLNFDFENTSSSEIYYSIDDAILKPKFWADILRSLDVETIQGYEDFKPRYRSNQIRSALNDFWSQSELDPAVRINLRYRSDRQQVLPQIKEPKKIVGFGNKVTRCFINFFEKIPKGKNLIELIDYIALRQLLVKTKRDICSKNFPMDKIHCITYRPEAPEGGRGGAGAVMSAMKSILGNKVENFKIFYSFSEKDGVWHSKKNKYFNATRYPVVFSESSQLIDFFANLVFIRDLTKEDNALYITHDYASAYALNLLDKQYILVVHSQGTRREEKEVLGEDLSLVGKLIISHCEKIALKNAKTVYFPSKGAEDSFFKSKYCRLNKADVKLGKNLYLYNTCYVKVQPKEVYGIPKNHGIKFLSVGTCTLSKGFDLTINYIGELLKNTKKEICWFWVGKGPLEQKVEEAANHLCSIYPNFTFIHFRRLSFEEVSYLMEQTDIYIMLHRKSVFDLATLEAMKAGCVLMLSPTGGNLEFNLSDNVIFVPKKDLILDDIDLQNLKRENRKVYEQNFSPEKFKTRYEQALNEVMENKFTQAIDKKDEKQNLPPSKPAKNSVVLTERERKLRKLKNKPFLYFKDFFVKKLRNLCTKD